jgi:predicted glutamate--cysteine ligase
MRWGMFPRTPSRVPLFESHWHHIRWMEEQLASGTIQNVRHLWASVRPNGDRRPYHLNRLELRICDLIADPVVLLAVTALLEARLTQLLRDPSLDPLESSTLPASTRAQDLLDLTDANETAAARSSLDAQLRHWQDGRPIRARDWIAQLYQQVQPIAQQQGFSCFLSPIQTLLRDGNTAQQWLQQYERGRPIRSILQAAIAGTERGDRELEERLCQLLAA